MDTAAILPATLNGVEFIKRLRRTGMSIAQIRHYVELNRQGEGTLDERRELLEAHQRAIEAHLEEVIGHLDAIKAKIALYYERDKVTCS